MTHRITEEVFDGNTALISKFQYFLIVQYSLHVITYMQNQNSMKLLSPSQTHSKYQPQY